MIVNNATLKHNILKFTLLGPKMR